MGAGPEKTGNEAARRSALTLPPCPSSDGVDERWSDALSATLSLNAAARACISAAFDPGDADGDGGFDEAERAALARGRCGGGFPARSLNPGRM